MFIAGLLLSIPEMVSIADIILIENLILLMIFCHHSKWRVKDFFSHRFWNPISKLGLTIYLITGYYLFTIYERETEPLEVENELHFVSCFIAKIIMIFNFFIS